MLRQFGFLVSAAVVVFVSHGGVVSRAPACEPCAACNDAPQNIEYAPPTRTRIRWVAVYEDGRVRYVPRAYRVRNPDPASRANTTSPFKTPAAKDLPVPSPAEPSPVQPGPVQPGPVPKGPAPSDSATADRLALANHAQDLLKTKCVRCHGASRQESGLDLRSRKTILKGGESGPALIPGQPDESLVFQRVRGGEMPPRNAGRLSPAEIETLREWIAAGAPSERAQQP
jgi:mono/diheme cytochrome c family protein